MDIVPPSEDRWRRVPLRALTFVTCLLVSLAILASLIFGVLPLLGISLDSLPNPRDEPVRTVATMFLGVAVLFAACLVGAATASWVALRRSSREEVRSEFIWLVWRAGAASRLCGRIFDVLFPEEGNAHGPPNTSFERTREG
jgi:hypothetical protein